MKVNKICEELQLRFRLCNFRFSLRSLLHKTPKKLRLRIQTHLLDPLALAFLNISLIFLGLQGLSREESLLFGQEGEEDQG